MEKKNNHKIVSVLLSGPYNKTFDYIIEKKSQAKIGQVIIVPFGNREVVGMIFKKSKDSFPFEKLKKVKSVVNLPVLSKFYIEFIEFFSNWNCIYKGNVLKMILSPFETKNLQNFNPEKYKLFQSEQSNIIKNYTDINLNHDQKTASKKIINALKRNISRSFLLDGVAGSGKTETYFEAVKYCIKKGKQILILLPEIGLTTEWELRFEKSFGFKPMIWHSGVSISKKKNIWFSVLFKKNLVIVGTRSAVFLPFKNLGLIVVDEEHDLSFKQDEGIRYHARDMSVYLAVKTKIPIVLSSATPSIESVFNVYSKKFYHLDLPSRATGSALPEIKIIDLKKNPIKKGHWVSNPLMDELKERYKNNEQSLIFLNRRGYSAYTLCRKCGYRVNCKNCYAWLVEHKKTNTFLCHHCGFKKALSKYCENCHETEMISSGPGIEKISEEIKKIFPNANVEDLSSDTIQNPDNFKKILKKIVNGKVDIIIGTQILAKGYDFPKLNFVGIIDGDFGIFGSDLRSSEKCFQLLSQVAGRAGRHIKNKKGLVYIQTYNPEDDIIKIIKKIDREKFFEQELKTRKLAFMPPYSRLISLILSSKSENFLNEFSFTFLKNAPNYKEIDILGPAPAPLSYIRGRHRIRFLIRSGRNINIQRIVSTWVESISIPRSIKLNIDVDPYNFL